MITHVQLLKIRTVLKRREIGGRMRRAGREGFSFRSLVLVERTSVGNPLSRDVVLTHLINENSQTICTKLFYKRLFK